MELNKFELFIFDLDGTLTRSRSSLKLGINLLVKLLSFKKVIIISGGPLSQIMEQVVNILTQKNTLNLSNLYLAPLSGGTFYTFKNDKWNLEYSDQLNKTEKEKIITELKKALKQTGYKYPNPIPGIVIDDRGGQITFSALGNEAPIDIKEIWDPKHKKRQEIKDILDKTLPEFKIGIGGTTSIDIKHAGIDKAYGIKKIAELLKTPFDKIVFFGDKIFLGGNDYSATTLPIKTISVKNEHETKMILNGFLNSA